MGRLTYFLSLILPNVFFYLVLQSFCLPKGTYSAFPDFATLTSVRECFVPRLLDWSGLSRNPWEDSWYPRDWRVSMALHWVPGSLLKAFICRKQDSGACSWASAVSKNFSRSVQNVGEFRWKLASEGKNKNNRESKNWGRSGIYSLLKMMQPCPWKGGPFFLTRETRFLWITPICTSWNLESLLVLFTCTF